MSFSDKSFLLDVRFLFLLVVLYFLMWFGFLWGRKSLLGNSPKDKRSEKLIQTESYNSLSSDKYYFDKIARITVIK